jgi:methyl-accepting chemotaxis protein
VASEGDLRVFVKFEGQDPIGKIAHGPNHFLGKNKDNLLKIDSLAKTIKASSEELKTNGHFLTEQMGKSNEKTQESKSVTDQVDASIQESSRSMNEPLLSVTDIANNLRSNSDLTKEALESSSSASVLEEKLFENMKYINDITKIISGIAEQINLLALNATIEASRAGEQGKGFAVVANEVKTLAGKTNDSSEEIAKIVSEIQASAQNVGGAISKTMVNIQKASENANSISVVLEEQRSVTNTVSESMKHSAKEMSVISKSFSELEEASKASIDKVQKNEESSFHLDKVANNLSDIVSSFKL